MEGSDGAAGLALNFQSVPAIRMQGGINTIAFVL